MDKLVKEAKLEHYVVGTEREYRLEKRLVRCVQDINQNMGGLQSAANLQFQLLKQTQQGSGIFSPNRTILVRKNSSTSYPGVWSVFEDPVTLTPSGEPEDADLTAEHQTVHVPVSNLEHEGSVSTATPSPQRMFEVFIEHLGPSMVRAINICETLRLLLTYYLKQSFAFTLKEILEDIPFGPGPDHKVSFNTKFHSSLDRALKLYRDAREAALASVYRERDFVRIQSPDVEADLEEVSASCGHFSFTLMEFGEQLKDLLQILDELKLECDERPQGLTWNWLKFWRVFKSSGPESSNSGKSTDMSKFIQSLIHAIEYSNLALTSSGRPHLRKGHSSLESGYTDDIRLRNKLTYRVWKSFSFLRRDETKYAVKVGVGAAVLDMLDSLAHVSVPVAP